MKKFSKNKPMRKRLSALLLALVMLLGMVPTTVFGAPTDADPIETVADPQTLTRPDDIYGNDTEHAGKVTVGKSVSAGSVTVPLTDTTNTTISASGEDNFMVTVSQAAQIMGLTSETSVPVDVVFVLDTSGSMNQNNTDRVTPMVNAANSAIATLLAANEYNRVGVVAFSSAGYGGGTSDNAAASVLSSLAHYDGAAATNHLTRVNETGTVTNNGAYIAGRDTDTITIRQNGRNQTKTVNAFRDGSDGGTHIQAGIAAGAQLLANATGTTFTVDGNSVTRMPFLIVLSDGVPTYSSSTEEWYNPSLTGSQQGPGNDTYGTYTGNGFLPALTAAYYKGKITEHYYGVDADATNRCYIYTIGVQVGTANLATLTLNPREEFNANATGNNHDGRFASYWRTYNSGSPVTVSVSSNGSFTFNDVYSGRPQTAANNTYYQASKNWVNGLSSTGAALGYTGGIAYNDGYYSATQTSEINGIFDDIVSEITEKALSTPTKVTTTADFSGYVTFTDVIGEYMEVKDVAGLISGGVMYQGAGFARRLSGYGDPTSPNHDPEFDALFAQVLQTRLNMTDSMKNDPDFVDECIAQAKASANQANWTDADNYDNSLVWWGASYHTGEEDESVQNLGYADDDSITHIEEQKAAGTIPEGADYVCRSYFFYGTAGDTLENPNHEFLYFVIRVQRSLEAPYQQTVVVSAPASLLSMERVLIHESSDGSYTAEVMEELPARVVYEVGLRSDINPYNVKQIVADSYKNEAVNGTGTVNYDAATDTYNFFTNDWDRTQALDSHHRAMTKATFDAAADNAFYRYQEDETLYVLNGSTYTKYTGATLPNGVYYYARQGFSWSGQPTNGKYAAQPQTFYIKVDVEDDNRGSIVRAADNSWYIPAGLYTASTLQVAGDDVMKDDPSTAAVNDGNKTGSAATVAHPHRTGDVNNSHYTVLLGNNGLLSLKAKDAKTVDIDRGSKGTTIINDADGRAVMVGDTLTYTIEAINTEETAADIVITDKVPAGTEFVSAEDGGVHSSGTVTWTLSNVPAGASRSVSFQVKVTEDALSSTVVNITNQATVQIGNNPSYTTNTTTNPPEGKKATVIGGTVGGDVQVGSELTYEIRYANDTDTVQDVTITDIIPLGTKYIEGSATYANNANIFAISTNNDGRQVLTWTLANVQSGVTGVVSFHVTVTAEAAMEGGSSIQNYAEIKVGPNDPYVTTNSTETERKTGSVKLSKIVTGTTDDKIFTMDLVESTGTLSGTFTVESTNAHGTTDSVTFTGGTGTVQIKAGEVLTIKELPLNAHIAVTERDPGAGWTPTYTKQTAYVRAEGVETMSVANSYHTEPAWFQLSGTKTFVGSFPAGSTVTFVAQSCSAAGVVDGDRTVYATAQVDATGTTNFVFSGRNFSQEGTHYYLVKEYVTDANRIENVVYSDTVYLLKLVISDNDQGALVAATTIKTGTTATADWSAVTERDFAWATEKLAFTNTYYGASAPVTISGTKTITGDTMMDGEFLFELVDAAGKVVSTAVQVEDDVNGSNTGTFSFAPITYTLADLAGADSKVFTYTVKETAGNLPGMTYDSDTFTVAVTVTKNTDGTLSTAYTVNGSATEAIAFQNSYTNTDFVTYTPTVNKKLVERASVAGEFRFEVVELTYNGTTYVEGNVVSRGINTAAAANTAGTVTFQPIGFVDENVGAAGDQEHYYLIREVAGSDSTVTYDTQTKYYLYVKVHDDGQNNLTVTESKYYSDAFATEITASDDVLFTNHYGSGDIVLNVPFTKELISSTTKRPIALAGSEFDFEIYQLQNNFGAKIDADPATATVIDPITVGTNGASVGGVAAIEFNTVRITKDQMTGAVQDFFYVVEEVKPSNADASGLSIDEPIYVKLTVSHDGYGNLEVTNTAYYRDADKNGTIEASELLTGTGATGAMFTNGYEPDGVSVTIPVEKQLMGKRLTNEQFTFEISGGHLSSAQTIRNDANGDAAFTLDYTAGAMSGVTMVNGVLTKTFTYTIKERTGVSYPDGTAEADKATGSYSYDGTSYTVTVTVTDDGSGQLKAAVAYAAGMPPVFTNYYTPAPATLDLDTELTDNTKTVVYPDGTAVPNYDLTKFSFAVTDALGNELSTGTTNANGKVTFDPELTFTEAREYHFWIAEKSAADSAITIDQRRWEVHVVVDYDAATGALSVKNAAVYPIGRAAEEVSGIHFVNIYEPAPATLTITADKTLTGRDLQAGEFRFQLLEEVGTGADAATLIRAEAVNAAPDEHGESTITFRMNYTYADIGRHTYTMVEVDEGKGGVDYDDGAFTVIVYVEDHDGQITVHQLPTLTAPYPAITTLDSGADFANTYQAAPVDVTITAFKNLTGKALDADAYTFELEDAAGTIVTAKNNARGRIEFTKTFEAATEQPVVYTLREKNDAQGGVTYDTAEYKVTISVIDDLNGRLIPTVSYTTADGKPIELSAPVFKNSYAAASAEVKLVAEKELKGRDMKDGEFLFKVYDSTGGLVSTGGNTAKGEVVFDTITFSEVGTYTLRVVEADTGDKEITYDKTEYEVSVEITDDGEGQLEAEVTYPDGDITFVNTWEKQEHSPNTGDNFNTPLMAGLLLFSMAAVAALIFLYRRKKEDAAE